MTTFQQYLQQFFGLTEEETEKMSAFFKEESLKKGEFYIREEQLCDRLSFIASGYIRIYSDYNGKEVTQWISTPNYFITEIQSFMFGARSRFKMQALEDCQLYSISKEDYNALGQHIDHWDQIQQRFITACFATLENRVFDHLSLTAEERYDKLFENNKDLFMHVPLQYLASMLGMSAETFSRIRKKKIS